jgi:hypothetical protein
MKPMRAFAAALLPLAALLATLPAGAQNLIANGDFDSDVAGWTPNVGYMVVSHDSEDVGEPSPSGSALVSNQASQNAGNGVGQCVLIDAGAFYDAEVWARIPPGQATTGQVELGLFWFSSQSCDFADFIGPDYSSQITAPSGSWAAMDVVAIEAPIGAESVQFDLRALKDGPETFEAKFDVAFLPEPRAPLGASAGIAVLTLLHRIRRRGRATARSRLDQTPDLSLFLLLRDLGSRRLRRPPGLQLNNQD